jgi:hypothetical protein
MSLLLSSDKLRRLSVDLLKRVIETKADLIVLQLVLSRCFSKAQHAKHQAEQSADQIDLQAVTAVEAVVASVAYALEHVKNKNKTNSTLCDHDMLCRIGNTAAQRVSELCAIDGSHDRHAISAFKKCGGISVFAQMMQQNAHVEQNVQKLLGLLLERQDDSMSHESQQEQAHSKQQETQQAQDSEAGNCKAGACLLCEKEAPASQCQVLQATCRQLSAQLFELEKAHFACKEQLEQSREREAQAVTAYLAVDEQAKNQHERIMLLKQALEKEQHASKQAECLTSKLRLVMQECMQL